MWQKYIWTCRPGMQILDCEMVANEGSPLLKMLLRGMQFLILFSLLRSFLVFSAKILIPLSYH